MYNNPLIIPTSYSLPFFFDVQDKSIMYVHGINKVPPFQITRPAGVLPILSVKVNYKDGSDSLSINSSTNIVSLNGNDVLLFYGVDFNIKVPYYIEVTDGTYTWFSRWIRPVCEYVEIRYFDCGNVGSLVYDGVYQSILHIEGIISENTYEHNEQLKKTFKGEIIKESHIMTHKVICDDIGDDMRLAVANLIPLHKNVYIDGRDVSRVLIGKVDWIDDTKNNGKYTIELVTTVTYKAGCCNDDEDVCLDGLVRVKGLIDIGSTEWSTGVVNGIQLSVDDLVLANDTSLTPNKVSVKKWNGVSFGNPIIISHKGLVVHNDGNTQGVGSSSFYLNSDTAKGYVNYVKITSFTDNGYSIYGQLFRLSGYAYDGFIEVWAGSNSQPDEIIQIDTSDKFNNTYIEITRPAWATHVYIVSKRKSCGVMGTSESKYFPPKSGGIGVMGIENNFIII